MINITVTVVIYIYIYFSNYENTFYVVTNYLVISTRFVYLLILNSLQSVFNAI